MANADAVLDYLLLKGSNAQGQKLTQLALLKLLFFIEGWSNALLGKSIIDEPFQAWRLGPVLVSQRKRLRSFGPEPVPVSIANKEKADSLPEDVKGIIDEVWRRYALENPGTLVGLTHLLNSPWHLIRKQNDVLWDDDSNVEIPKTLVSKYFMDLLDKARKQRIEDAIKEHSLKSNEDESELQALLLTEWDQFSGSGGNRAWVTQSH